MEYALDRFAREIRTALEATGRIPADQIELATPKPNIPADLAFPTFRSAKTLGVAPPQLAQELATTVRFTDDALVGGVQATGPFLNFALDTERFVTAVFNDLVQYGANYGRDDRGANQTVLVEYSSPNVARRMHVGHIRSTIIGQALFNIMQALGYQTISDNHLGDWGKQFGLLIMGVVRDGQPSGSDEEALLQLEHVYTKYTALAKNDSQFDDEARAWSLRLEQGDQQARAIWQWIVDLTMRYINPLYARLGARFDTVHGESFYEDKMEPVIHKALDMGLAVRSKGKLNDENGPTSAQDDDPTLADDDGEGALVVKLDGLPTFLLQRADGGTLYLTRDIATIIYREHKYNPVTMIYAVDMRQELHFRQVFAFSRALGYAQNCDLIHVPFGTVFSADGRPLSTRHGNMVYLQALLDEAHQRARAVVDQASANLPEAEKEQIAEAVGVGAVIYNDLYQDPRRNITLDWERMLSIEGNSAPYIQYMHARMCSILRNAAESGFTIQRDPTVAARSLTHPTELAAMKQIARLPAAVRAAGERYLPFVIAEWCYDMARAISAFYRDCPVLKAETADLRTARLQLVAAAAQVLKTGLSLLSIRAPDRM
jgi:arginyl-tRNA synthetase